MVWRANDKDAPELTESPAVRTEVKLKRMSRGATIDLLPPGDIS